MAITGYEVDQVFANGTSVPVSWAYNHHYIAMIYNKKNVDVEEIELSGPA